MASHTNPNRPSKTKRPHHRVTKQRRKQQISKPAMPQTSQALRQAAAPSKKKARKLDKKARYAKARAAEDQFRQRDADGRKTERPLEMDIS